MTGLVWTGLDWSGLVWSGPGFALLCFAGLDWPWPCPISSGEVSKSTGQPERNDLAGQGESEDGGNEESEDGGKGYSEDGGKGE